MQAVATGARRQKVAGRQIRVGLPLKRLRQVGRDESGNSLVEYAVTLGRGCAKAADYL